MPAASGPIKVKPKLRFVKPPKGDVASSGGDYGKKRAAPTVKRELKAIRTRQSQVKDTKGTKDLQRAPRYIKSLQPKRSYSKIQPVAGHSKALALRLSMLPPDLAAKASEKQLRIFHEQGTAKTLAPAVSVLNQTLRPIRTIAGVTDAAITHKNVLKAAERGALHNKGPTFSTVLKHAGAPKGVQKFGGLALDIVADPTTYATFGAGSVARKAAQKEGERILAKASKAGMPDATAKKLADRAAQRAYDAHPGKNKGLQVGARLHVPFTNKTFQAKTSGRATAAVSRATGASKVATKVRQSGPVQGLGKTFVHDFRPKDRTPAQHEVIRAAQLEHRATVAAGERAILRRYGKALRKATPKGLKDHQAVVDAIEAGTVHQLPQDLQSAARAISGDLGAMHKSATARGLSIGKFKPQGPTDAQAYVPHVRRLDLEPGAKGGKGGTTKVAADQGRTIRKPLKTLRAEDPSIFTEDLPRIMASKGRKELHRRSLHDMWQKVAATGREVKPHTNPDMHLGDERFYKVTPHGLEAVVKAEGAPDLNAMRDILAGKKSGRYVILNRHTVDDVKARLANAPSNDEFLRAYDKVQGKLKTLYTVPNPAYHARNLLGDTQNAFLGDATTRSFAQARAVLGSRISRNRAESKSLTGPLPAKLNRTVKINGKSYTHAQLLKEAEEHGAINQGFIGRELRDLSGQSGPITRASQYREDLPRLATYLAARHRGMTPAEAADWSLKHHFDYADLTTFERTVARRGIPFYTFFARNTRLQATKVFTRPGKQATIAKVLNTAAQAAGFQDYNEYAGQLKNYKQRGLPIPVSFNGKVYDVQFGTPTADLNQLTANAKTLMQDVANRATFYKTLFELPLNYSVFFQSQIQDPSKPRVAAPMAAVAAIQALPGPLQDAASKKVGLAKIRDPKTGKMIWGWYSKWDYALRAAPEGNLIAGVTAQGTGSRGQSPTQQGIGFLTGLKITDHAKTASPLSVVGQQLHDLQNKLGEMRQRNQSVGKDGYYTPAYTKLLDEAKRLTAKRDALRTKEGQPGAPQGKRHPLTPAQQVAKEIADFKAKQADPGAAVRKEIEAFKAGR